MRPASCRAAPALPSTTTAASSSPSDPAACPGCAASRRPPAGFASSRKSVLEGGSRRSGKIGNRLLGGATRIAGGAACTRQCG